MSFLSKSLNPAELALFRQASTNKDLAALAFQSALGALAQKYKLEEGDSIQFDGTIKKAKKKRVRAEDATTE